MYQINEQIYEQLVNATRIGDFETVKRLVQDDRMIGHYTKDGKTLLHVAASRGHTETVKCLLTQGAKVNQADKDGETPLHWAAQNGHTETVEYLLTQGVKVDQTNNDGWTPLYVAASRGHTEIVKCLLTQGAKVDQATKNGWTPLYVAASRGHTETVKCLLTQDAKVNHADKNGETPLYVAALNDHTETVKCLLTQDAKVNHADKNGETPLHGAAWKGNTETVKCLLTQGAKVDQATKNGWTPLYLAAWSGQTETVKCLLTQGAKVDQANKNGETPLYVAALSGQTETVRCLLEHGANPQLQNTAVSLPVVLANNQKHMDTAKYLQYFKKPLPIDFVFSKNYSALIRAWYPKVNKQTVSTFKAMSNFFSETNIGHVSISIRSGQDVVYISHWPGETARFLKSVASHNNNLLEDLGRNGEDGLPDMQVMLYSLDTIQMISRFKAIGDKARWFLGGNNKFANKTGDISHSCASYVQEILTAGGLFAHLLPKTDKLKSPMTPGQIAELVKKAQMIEQILYPETKPFFAQEIQTFKEQLLQKSTEGFDQLNAFLAINPDYAGFLYTNGTHESMTTLLKTMEINLKKSASLELLALAKTQAESSIMKNMILPRVDKQALP